MNPALFEELVEFLKPFVEGTDSHRVNTIQLVLQGSPALQHLSYSGGSLAFANHLVKTVETWGESDDLCRLVTKLSHNAGTKQQKKAVQLCTALNSRTRVTESTVAPILPAPSPSPRMRDHIFISYSHDDRSFVDRLAEDLRRQGHIMWVDFGGIRGGDVWRQSISDGIHASAIVLVVITETALQSEWVSLEVQTALDTGKPIIPLLLDSLSASARKSYERLGLEAIQFRDFGVGYEEAFTELLKDIPKPQAGLPGYCQKLIARLANTPWGLDHYIQEEAKILPIHASPYDEGLQQGASENLLKHLWRGKRTIVLGEPGIGKSVALERLAWELASNEPPITPILINLREYDGLPLLEWIRLKLLESDEQAIRHALQKPDDIEQFLHEMPFTFYLLLDGLNEVRPQYRDEALQQIRRLSLMYPQHPIVVTSRVQDESWRELRGGSFKAETVVVQAIASHQAQHYLAAHLSVDDANDLWGRLDARMQDLATTPLLLWLIKEAWLETRGRIPGNRGELYANFIERMLRRDDDRKLNQRVSREERLNALDKLALAMHSEKAVSFSIQQVKAIIADERILTALLVNGLLQGETVIRFAPHQTVQEHFAARAIQNEVKAELNKPERSWFRKLISQPDATIFDSASDPWWAETFIQLAGLSDNPNKLARKIAENNPWLAWWCVQEGQAVDPETERIIESQSALLVDSEDVQDRRNAVQALLKLPRARVIEQLAKLAIDGDSSVAEPARQALNELGETGKLAVAQVFEERIIRYTPKERSEIGQWLSEWGDMRHGVGVKDGLPDIDWVLIPAGGYSYQDGTKTLDYDFQMSRYPVTYAQFQSFIDDTEGFSDSRWWQGFEMPAGHNVSAGEQAFKYSNHPRERVSWYDAMAFCRWYSRKLGGGYDLAAMDEWAVRLPTEFEWEKVARGTDGREYPWGDGYKEGYANIDETMSNEGQYYLEKTTAVGIYLQGASPYGVLDMSGNVFEWCLTDYNNLDEDVTIENISSNSRRVLRGGSWVSSSVDARAVDRSFSSPVARFSSLGFRVCVPLL